MRAPATFTPLKSTLSDIFFARYIRILPSKQGNVTQRERRLKHLQAQGLFCEKLMENATIFAASKGSAENFILILKVCFENISLYIYISYRDYLSLYIVMRKR